MFCLAISHKHLCLRVRKPLILTVGFDAYLCLIDMKTSYSENTTQLELISLFFILMTFTAAQDHENLE